MESVIVALITGGLSLAGVVISNLASSRRMQYQLEKAQAITDVKIDELTREVRMHNNFAEKIPTMQEQIKVANHRIDDLEKGGK